MKDGLKSQTLQKGHISRSAHLCHGALRPEQQSKAGRRKGEQGRGAAAPPLLPEEQELIQTVDSELKAQRVRTHRPKWELLKHAVQKSIRKP